MKQVYLMVEENNYFADHIEFGKINLETILGYFKEFGIELTLLRLEDHEFPRDAIIFTTSSQKPYQKKYIDDYLALLEKFNNILIPSKEIIFAHENKGFQELYKKSIGLISLKSLYVNNTLINYDEVKKIGYPLVLKKLDGSGSKGVMLIHNERSLKKQINKIQPSLHIRYFIYLKERLKNIFLRVDNTVKVEYFKEYKNYVLQEFIPNLEFDYKVLIFFDKYYVLKRYTTANDFRASGSGKFEFIDIDSSLLEYAKYIFEKFEEPFMSLDICEHKNKYYLIEYQGMHFGPYAQIYAEGYYQKKQDQWKFIKKKETLEKDIAYSLYHTYMKLLHTS